VEKMRDSALFDMIPCRRTNHNLYNTKPILKNEMTRLHACCWEDGFRIFLTNEADNETELRRRIDDLITRADAIQLTDQTYKQELASWIGRGSFGAPWLMAKVTQLAVSHLNISKGRRRKTQKCY
jgi:hypothetical protein